MSKIIAWYLPQFYTFPENDRWWGEGFTEWTLLNKWQPCYPGHAIRRPHPDIGEYGLADKAFRRRQAELARAYGVHGFCYYHCWFEGKKLLEKPMEWMLADGEPDMPFCFSWTNQSWTRRWDGHTKEVIQAQTYGDRAEWDAHLDYLLPFFRHRNYLQVEGKPVFLVYRLGLIPQYMARFDHWRERLRREGFDGLHLVMTLGNMADNLHPLPGIDAVVEFFPNMLGRVNPIGRWVRQRPALVKHVQTVLYKSGRLTRKQAAPAMRHILNQPRLHERHYRGMFSGWDNSPRIGTRATIYEGLTPELFGDTLRQQIVRSDEFTFINAWNEWSEGAVLEPDDIHGYGFLEALARAVS